MNTKHIFLFVLLFCSIEILAKGNNKKNSVISIDTSIIAKKDSIIEKKKEDKKDIYKSLKEYKEKCRLYDGLFPMYQDTITGKMYIEISEDKLGNEFIYFSRVSNAAADVGYTKGAYKENKIFKISKYFDRIDWTIQNTQFYFDSTNAISKSADANINSPLVLSEKIIAAATDTIYDKDSIKKYKIRYLIEADALLFQENIQQVKPSKRFNEPPNSFSLGSLNSKKSKVIKISNYPENSDVEVEYVFENAYPTNYGSTEATDARFMTVRLVHSFIAMPINNFKPRLDDPRIGYFLDMATDMTSTSTTPYRDFINKWNLEKKDSAAILSEPIRPITFYMDKNTPKNWRPIIKSATESWNIAFEAAGFKNAIVCLEQPDSATWDAGDIRYNVISWTSSPNPPFGGYGPSFTNPRTGEILGADIMLEWVYLTNKLKHEKLFNIAGLESHENDNADCNASYYSMLNLEYGLTLLNSNNLNDIEKDEYISQSLKRLVLHEVGHTLGLNHNFIASCFYSIDEMNDKKLGETKGLTTSVMDYPLPNINEDKSKQGLYFDIIPGVYDIWAIQYGYTPAINQQNEEAILNNLLKNSTKKEFRFFNDADAKRSPSAGIDPRVMINDLSNDPLKYSENQIKLINNTYLDLLKKYTTKNQSFNELRNAYLILSTQYSNHLTVASRWIGGIYIDRSFTQQGSENKPYTTVEKEKQKYAMSLLTKYAFGIDAYKNEQYLYNYLQQQRRGNERQSDGEDPKIHDRILNIQKGILDQLLHPVTLQRIIDTKVYGNSYSIHEVFEDLTNSIFKEDINKEVNTIRQNLQTEYLKRLINIVNPMSTSYSSVAKAGALFEINKIKDFIKNPSLSLSTKIHKQYLSFIINEALVR